MSHIMKFALAALLASWITFICGCNGEAPPAAPASDATEGPALHPPQRPFDEAPQQGDQGALPTEGELAEQPAEPEQAEAAKIKANLASLSATDRELALKQKTCPVGGGPLGGMGTPKKISVAGLDVFICCEGCERPLLEDPAKYLAKIGLTPTNAPPVQ